MVVPLAVAAATVLQVCFLTLLHKRIAVEMLKIVESAPHHQLRASLMTVAPGRCKLRRPRALVAHIDTAADGADPNLKSG